MKRYLQKIRNRFCRKFSVRVRFKENKWSTSTMRVRQHLQKLMGTDVIRLNDKRYMDKLSMKLKEEYQRNMDKKEKQLEEAEKERLRKLMLEGVIPMQKKQHNKKKKNKHSHKHKENHHNSHHDNNTDDGDKHKEQNRKDRDKVKSKEEEGSDEEIITQVQLIEHTEPKEQNTKTNEIDDTNHSETKVDITDPTQRQHRAQPEIKHKQKMDDLATSSSEEHHQRTPSPASRPGTPRTGGKFAKIESHLIRQLREAKTVDDLYDIADKAVIMD